VHWSCKSQRDCDTEGAKCSEYQFRTETDIFRGLADRDNVLEMWYTLVSAFSHRSLTIDKDRLPAIGGIAEHFNLQLEDEYLAGIWRSSLQIWLLWTVNGLAKPYEPRSSTFLAPSWSWASTIQLTYYYIDNVCHRVPKVDVIKVVIGHEAKGAAYGNVAYGRLTLRGFITPVYWKLPRGPEKYPSAEITTPSTHSSALTIAIFRDAAETSLLAEVTDRIRAYLLALVTNDDLTGVVGLILHKHSDGKYSRLGVFTAPRSTTNMEQYSDMVRGFMANRRKLQLYELAVETPGLCTSRGRSCE
jgi:hypothetical protein